MRNLNNIVVFIKDEAMLEEARRILIENGEVIYGDEFYLNNSNSYNYLVKLYFGWTISFKITEDTEITLTELETRLKEK